MSFSIQMMCRGRGIYYFLINTQLVSNKYNVKVTSDSGVNLPFESYAGGSDREMVLAVPMLDVSKIRIEFYSDGDLCWKKTISASRIKWTSRYYYRTDWAGAHKIRDIEKFAFSAQVHIKPVFLLESPSDKKLILKGTVCYPSSDSDLSITVLDRHGKQLESEYVYLQSPCSVSYEGLPRMESSFTVRIPNDGNTYCIVAGVAGDIRAAFLCLDDTTRSVFLRDFANPFYRLNRKDDWYLQSLKRQRLLGQLDSADYQQYLESGVSFSIVVPLYNTPLSFFNDMVQSVISQVYRNWELILVNSTPENPQLAAAIGALNDSRIKVVTLDSNLGISDNTNKGIEIASGDYVVFFDHDDILDPMVLFKYAEEIAADPSIDALYCDEDLLTEDGFYVNPHFKSDFNLDLLRVHNYITHLLAVRSNFVKQLPLRKKFDGAQDYDFLLRLVDLTHNFKHVPEVLYHWRMSAASTAKDAGAKPYAEKAGLLALEEHFQRNKLHAHAEYTERRFIYKAVYDVEGEPLVSILIPNKDSLSILERCVLSVEEKSTYRNFEIIIIENNSVEDATFSFYNEIIKRFDNIRVVTWDGPFNYSGINNFGATFASGDYYVLLNNDTEVIEPSWIEGLLGYCQRTDVGIVGSKLLFPDDTVQHAGVAMLYCGNAWEAGGPVHVFANLDRNDPGYFNRAVVAQDVNIVTAACLMVKASIFNELGGLSERYAVAYNDVDFCLRVRKAGYLVVYNPDVLLYHYESFSRGNDTNDSNKVRFYTEQGKLREDWPEYFVNGDCYYSKMLNRADCYPIG